MPVTIVNDSKSSTHPLLVMIGDPLLFPFDHHSIAALSLFEVGNLNKNAKQTHYQTTSQIPTCRHTDTQSVMHIFEPLTHPIMDDSLLKKFLCVVG